MAEQYETVAIIPAKSVSKRLPEKNIKLFRGLPLFVWSVLYAHEEGVQPVVVTDSELVSHIAHGFGAVVYPQVEEQFDNYDHTAPIIKELGVKRLAFLQATSPLRKKGALQEALSLIPDICPSCYTVNRVKMHGHHDGKFVDNRIATGSGSYFNLCDGNIFCCTADYFLEHGNYMIGEESFIIPNEMPYTIDIDTLEDFEAAENLAVMQPELLVHPIKSIAVVQNKRILKRDYSEFIDSCDLVVRNGTMDNLNTGRAGKRVDIHFAVGWNHSYIPWMHPDERHLKEANDAAILFQFRRDDHERKIYRYSFGYIDNYKGPYNIRKQLDSYTSKALAIYHMHYTFPDATIYNLGTRKLVEHRDISKRTHGVPWSIHSYTKEEAMLDKLVEDGSMVDILEEDCTEERGNYSVTPTDGKSLPKFIILRGATWEAPYYLYEEEGRISTKENLTMLWAKIEKWEPYDELIVRSGYDNRRIVYKYNAENDVYATFDSYPSTNYTHIFAIGEDCTAAYLTHEHFKNACGNGPFDYTYIAGLDNVLKLIKARGEGTAEAEDLERALDPHGTYSVINKKTGQCFKHMLPNPKTMQELTPKEITIIQETNARRWERFLKALDDENNSVLLVYVSFGTQYRLKYPNCRMFHYGTNTTQPQALVLKAQQMFRENFKARVSLLYLDPVRTDSLPHVTYRDGYSLIHTHSQVVALPAAPRAAELAKECGAALSSAFTYAGVDNVVELKHVRHKTWVDNLYVDVAAKTGRRGKNDKFDVLDYVPGKKLTVYWKTWHTKETFEVQPNGDWEQTS